MTDVKLQAVYTEQDIPKGEELADYSSSGRKRPWRKRKMENRYLSVAYEEVDAHKAERLRLCANFLHFVRNPETGKQKLEGAMFCQLRLCPICSWRRSLKVRMQMMRVVQYLEQREKKYRWVMLTLTTKNVPGEELGGQIDSLMSAWKRLAQRKEVKSVMKGYYRALEVTHNVNPSSPSYDTYHPHFHVLIAVNPSYFTGRDYLNHERWRQLWREAARLDYDPQVDIRRMKGLTPKDLAELAKYTAKSGEYILPEDWELTVGTVRTLDAALAHRRFLAFGGCIAEARRKLALDDAEDGDLIHVEEDSFKEDEKNIRVTFLWYSGYQQYYSITGG